VSITIEKLRIKRKPELSDYFSIILAFADRYGMPVDMEHTRGPAGILYAFAGQDSPAVHSPKMIIGCSLMPVSDSPG